MSVEMVSDSTFQKSVIDASQEKLVVVEFSTVDKTPSEILPFSMPVARWMR